MVVISGRNTPSAEYRLGMLFFKNISTNCTSAAITRMKAIVCKYSKCSGTSTRAYTRFVAILASVITKITAAPIPMEVSTFLETPRNGHRPWNWLRMMLLTRADPTIIKINSFI